MNWKAFLKPLLPIGVFVVVTLITLSLFRFGFIVWQWERVTAAHAITDIIVQGMRFDLVLLGYLLIIPATLTPFAATHPAVQKYWQQLLRVYFLLCGVAIVFMEMATPSFITQYDARPNYLFIEYLKYPREVFDTLWGAYKIQLVAAAITCGLVIYLGWRTTKPLREFRAPLGLGKAAIVSPVILILCALAARSTLDHRAINPSMAAVSPDPMVNEMGLNSSYSLLYALYEAKRDENGGVRYGDLPEQKMLATIRQDMHVADRSFTDSTIPTLHTQAISNKLQHPYNLVIILEESLGAEFVGSLGGKSLTPNLDRFADQGIWFKNLYATGTRSVRGIEAVISGFPPTAARSVVKLNKTQRHFFTLAQLLREKGYHTSFIYGGEAQFDNMGRFFMNNGFEQVVDQHDYESPQFTGSWGVSDGDLFNRAHKEFLNHGDQPFFSLVFSSSNHSPFEFPDGKISLYNSPKNTVENAVKYADYALGQYLDKAKNSSYWDNTIFLVVADHNSRVYGPESVPVYRFHIPGLILGGGIKPQVFRPVASQIDLAPTLLSLMGVANTNPMIGHDLTEPYYQDMPGRALLQFHATFGFMEGNHLVVLQKNLAPQQYLVENDHLAQSEPIDPGLEEKALSYSLWASTTVDKQRYNLHETDNPAITPPPLKK
jgi:phosphoglycerol transferase MdoB-like AlkP superfamily enzyme